MHPPLLLLALLASPVLAQDDGSDVLAVVLQVILIPLFIIFVIAAIWQSVYVVKQKEVVIIERLGKFHTSLHAGVHFVIPFIDRPKKYFYKYYLSDPSGRMQVQQKYGEYRMVTATRVMDFPAQVTISRDNAAINLDAVLSYRIVNPKLCIYSVTNLPNVLSKLLQAQLRSVAGSLDVDQIIEESSTLHVLTGMLDAEAVRWGVKIVFVKVQRVEAPGLQDVLAKKKNADLRNKEVIIGAKAQKQTTIIESEGRRDSMIKKAEGSAQEVLSKARGDAQATINFATAEARTIKEIARAVKSDGGSPTRYLLALKYMDALSDIVSKKGTDTKFLPKQSQFLQTAQDLGMNVIVPAGDAKKR
jgi:regulator of protease activity HflC (stomatin/prohibitin superfamily)